MEGVLNWIKGIVILFIITNVLLYLVQGKIYEKYIGFFMRLLIIVAVISPIATVVYGEEEFLDNIAYVQFWQDLERIRKDSERIGYANQEYCREEYEQVVEEDVRRLLEREEYQSSYVKVQLTDAYAIEMMQIGISGKTDTAEDSAAKEMMETIRIEEITVGEGMPDKDAADDGAYEAGEGRDDSTTENRYRKLKEKLMEYYQIDGNQIVIEEAAHEIQ